MYCIRFVFLLSLEIQKSLLQTLCVLVAVGGFECARCDVNVCSKTCSNEFDFEFDISLRPFFISPFNDAPSEQLRFMVEK